MGRILNRFTYDVDVVDTLLTQSMSMFMISCSWYVAGVVVMCSILFWVLLAIVPVTAAYWFLMLYYRKSGADLQRLDAVSRSPIQAMVNEGKSKTRKTYNVCLTRCAKALRECLASVFSVRWIGSSRDFMMPQILAARHY